MKSLALDLISRVVWQDEGDAHREHQEAQEGAVPEPQATMEEPAADWEVTGRGTAGRDMDSEPQPAQVTGAPGWADVEAINTDLREAAVCDSADDYWENVADRGSRR